jgi:hypothetical protein
MFLSSFLLFYFFRYLPPLRPWCSFTQPTHRTRFAPLSRLSAPMAQSCAGQVTQPYCVWTRWGMATVRFVFRFHSYALWTSGVPPHNRLQDCEMKCWTIKTNNMDLIPVIACVMWLQNVQEIVAQEPTVMLRQGTIRGVSTHWHSLPQTSDNGRLWY